MKSELRISSPNWRVTLTVGFFATLIIVILATLFRFEFGIILLAVAGVVAGVGGVFVVRGAVAVVKEFHLMRLARYQADKAELDASFMSFPKSHRVITLKDGRPVEMPPPVGMPPAALPAPEAEERMDLLQVFTRLGRAYSIVGGQQTGKTWQARHIAAYWLARGVQPIMVGPKWDKGEWEGCIRLGGGGNYQAVERGYQIVHKLATERHADTERGHKEHPPQPVFLDDLTTVIEYVSSAKNVILDATTLYASVNIVLYIIIHSDSADAYGLARKGAAIKNDLVKLFIVPTIDKYGEVNHNQTKGFVRLPGVDEERPVDLFVQPPRIPGPVNVVEPVALPEIEPTQTEQTILDMHQQGHSKGAICEAVWGYRSSNRYPDIEATLAKFGA